ncbi:ABC transporter ATP-binding protein [Microbacterium sp. NPDC089189]|uniref:ABC transporter ATP-binding protein n=1 Tax=Microbacterium sp. NPDC089189 TaxID=3154972 RepID=UPI0034135789
MSGVSAARPAAGAAMLEVDVTVAHPGFTLTAQLAAAAGETVAVMGPSGAGKSTLLAAMAGLIPLQKGAITLAGDVLSEPGAQIAAARRGTVLLGQDPRLFPHLDVRENVAFGLRASGAPARAARAQAEQWLARVGLDGAGARRPAELSGGQQQRVAIARALAAEPRLVLLDEPLTSLDPVTADGIRSLLGEHLAGRTCVFVTHDAVDAVAIADRVAVIEGGRVTQAGAVRDILRAPATPFVAALAGLNRIIGTAVPGGIRCGAITVPAPDVPGAARGAEVAAVFRPARVRIVAASSAEAAEGAEAGGTWRTTVARVEPTLSGVRIHTVDAGIAVDATLDDLAVHDLRPGTPLRLAVDADDVRVLPA